MSQFFTSGGQSFSCSINLSNEYSRLISFRIHWLDLLASVMSNSLQPMNRSMPGLPVHHLLLEFSLPRLMSIELVMPSNHLIPCCPLLLLSSIFPRIRVFSSESTLHTGGRSIGVSTSASVLPMNNQDWSPLGWTC